MVNRDRKEGNCRLNVDGNGCEYLHILSYLETKLRINTKKKKKKTFLKDHFLIGQKSHRI